MHFLSKVYHARLLNFNGTFHLFDDPVGGLDLEQDQSTPRLLSHVIFLITKMIGEVAVLFADLLLIYVMSRFKKLKEGSHVYIWHFALMNLLATISLLSLEIAEEFYRIETESFICPVYSVSFAVWSCALWMILFSAVDWYLSCTYNRHLPFLRKYSLIAIYAMNTLNFIMYLAHCCTPHFPAFQYLGIVTLVTIVICIGIINVLATCNKQLNEEHVKTKYVLTLSTYYLASWSSYIFLYFAIDIVSPDEGFLFGLMLDIHDIVDIIVSISPLLIVYWLGRWNNNFKIAYKLVLGKCRKQKSLNETKEMQEMLT